MFLTYDESTKLALMLGVVPFEIHHICFCKKQPSAAWPPKKRSRMNPRMNDPDQSSSNDPSTMANIKVFSVASGGGYRRKL